MTCDFVESVKRFCYANACKCHAAQVRVCVVPSAHPLRRGRLQAEPRRDQNQVNVNFQRKLEGTRCSAVRRSLEGRKSLPAAQSATSNKSEGWEVAFGRAGIEHTASELAVRARRYQSAIDKKEHEVGGSSPG